MSREKNDGGPAYPVEGYYDEDGSFHGAQTGNRKGWHSGMSLRDHFAAMAPPEEINVIMVHSGWTNLNGETWLSCVTAARMMWADAMLKAREQP
jgi:hypothetical protein